MLKNLNALLLLSLLFIAASFFIGFWIQGLRKDSAYKKELLKRDSIQEAFSKESRRREILLLDKYGQLLDSVAVYKDSLGEERKTTLTITKRYEYLKKHSIVFRNNHERDSVLSRLYPSED